jgi:hypothetical protein
MDQTSEIATLRAALRNCLHVIEKGIEVRMDDRWPVLKDLLPGAVAQAKEALAWSNPVSPIDCVWKATEDAKKQLGRRVQAMANEVAQIKERWLAGLGINPETSSLFTITQFERQDLYGGFVFQLSIKGMPLDELLINIHTLRAVRRNLQPGNVGKYTNLDGVTIENHRDYLNFYPIPGGPNRVEPTDELNQPATNPPPAEPRS